MNGVEHYARAEALLESCYLDTSTDDDGRIVERYTPIATASEDDDETHALMAAQVHATLALAAAVAADRSISPAMGWGGHTVSADMRDEGGAYR